MQATNSTIKPTPKPDQPNKTSRSTKPNQHEIAKQPDKQMETTHEYVKVNQPNKHSTTKPNRHNKCDQPDERKPAQQTKANATQPANKFKQTNHTNPTDCIT